MTLQKLLIPILSLSILFGCSKIYREHILEEAVVNNLEHKKAYSTTGITMGTDGNLSLKTKHHPAQYNVGFDGEVDFEVNNEKIFKRFDSVGEPAIVEYNEVWWVKLKDTDGDGEKEIVDRELAGYEFLDAYPK